MRCVCVLVPLLVSLPSPMVAALDAPAGPRVHLSFENSTLRKLGGERIAKSPRLACPDACIRGTTGVRGVHGNALRFRSTEDVVFLGSPVGLDPATGVTVAAWVRPSRFAGANYVVSSEDWKGGATRGFVLRITRDGRPEFTIGNDGWRTASGEPVEAGRWVHLAGTADADSVTLYVDGRRVAQEASHGAPAPSSYGITVGRGNYDRSRGFLGDIDEVWVDDRVLSTEGIRALFEHAGGDTDTTSRAADSTFHRPWFAGEASSFGESKYSGAKLLDHGDHGVFLLAGSREKYTLFRSTSGGGFRSLADHDLPDGIRERMLFLGLDAASDRTGAIHVVASTLEYSTQERLALYARWSPDGSVEQPWTVLNEDLRVHAIYAPPVLFPLRDGSVGFFAQAGSHDARGLIVRGKIVGEAVDPGRQVGKEGDTFHELVAYGRLAGRDPRRMQVLAPKDNDLVWVDAGTGAMRTAARDVLIARDNLHGLNWRTHTARDGSVYALTEVHHDGLPEPGETEIASRPVHLRVSRGIAGEELREVAIISEPFEENVESTLVESPSGEVFLIAEVPDRATPLASHSRIAAWKISGDAAECLGVVARSLLVGTITAALTASGELHVVVLSPSRLHATMCELD